MFSIAFVIDKKYQLITPKVKYPIRWISREDIFLRYFIIIISVEIQYMPHTHALQIGIVYLILLEVLERGIYMGRYLEAPI